MWPTHTYTHLCGTLCLVACCGQVGVGRRGVGGDVCMGGTGEGFNVCMGGTGEGFNGLHISVW